MKFRALFISASVAFSLVACANNPFSSYKANSDQVLTKIYTGDLAKALPVESSADPIYNLEYGSLQRLKRNYTQSNNAFNIVQQGEAVWLNSWLSSTGGELTASATSMLLNDNANAYQLRGYEKTFVPTYHALNHLDLNNWDNARIEVKRMYQIEQATENYNQALYTKERQDQDKISKDGERSYLYKQIVQKYDFKDINAPAVLALKNSYQNAFSHYLAGFVFEALNEPSLARPGYVKAGQLNPNNKLIQASIDRIDNNQRPKAGMSEVLIVEETGHAPQIQSEEIHIPIDLNFTGQQNVCINMIDVFYPRLILDAYNNMVYAYSVDNTVYTPELMTDVSLMLARAIHDETPHIIARNIAAAVRNIATSQAVCSGGGSLGSLLSLGTSLGGALLDRADERSWVLLPSKIYINRVQLAYGERQLKVVVNGQAYNYTLKVNQPYQVVSFRVLGNQVLFNAQS